MSIHTDPAFVAAEVSYRFEQAGAADRHRAAELPRRHHLGDLVRARIAAATHRTKGTGRHTGRPATS